MSSVPSAKPIWTTATHSSLPTSTYAPSPSRGIPLEKAKFWAVDEVERRLIVASEVNSFAFGICLSASIYALQALVGLYKSSSSRKRFALLGYWVSLFVMSMIYFIPTVVDQSTYKVVVFEPYRDLVFMNWWQPNEKFMVVWFITTMLPDALLVYLLFRSWGKESLIPKISAGVAGVFFFFTRWGGFDPTFLSAISFALFELAAVLLLFVRFILDKKEESKGKVQEDSSVEKVLLSTLLTLNAYVAVRVFWVFTIWPIGGVDIWSNTMVFMAAFVLQNLFIASEVGQLKALGETGHIALPLDPAETPVSPTTS